MIVLNFLLSIIFLSLAAIHFYWALGGKWGISNTLPTNIKGKKKLNPGKFSSAIVGFGLLTFGMFYFINSEASGYTIPPWISNIGGWAIPALFILRAIGDFKYVGVFKKIKNTSFGRLDTRLFSPLCFVIGFTGLIIKLV